MSKVMMVIGVCALSLCLTGCEDKKDEAARAEDGKAKVEQKAGAVADAAAKTADAAKAATKKN